MNKIELGWVNKEIKAPQSYNKDKNHLSILGESLYIDKHKWDCGWYWGFGYIGNRNLYTHCDVFIDELLWRSNTEVFESSIFKNNNDFWVFKDLLKQAYSLKSTSEVYQNGGHCTTKKGITTIIQNKQRAKWINNDLEKVLNTLWSFLGDLSKTGVTNA